MRRGRGRGRRTLDRRKRDGGGVLTGPWQVLRSACPADVAQEFWALLCACQLIHTAPAAAATAGLDPDRISYTITLRATRRALTTSAPTTPSAPKHCPATATSRGLPDPALQRPVIERVSGQDDDPRIGRPVVTAGELWPDATEPRHLPAAVGSALLAFTVSQWRQSDAFAATCHKPGPRRGGSRRCGMFQTGRRTR